MAWRGRGKGSSDIIKRGSAFRPAVSDSYEPFPESHPVLECGPVDASTELLINGQRLLVNHLLNPGEETLMRVHLGEVQELFSKKSLWKQLASEIGAEFYPSELMTDSKSVLFGIASKKSSPKKSASTKASSALAALESSENKGPDEEQSPRSEVAESEESDDSIGGDDYNVGRDFEDEGARDDYGDEGGDDGGGGDYGGEI